MTTTAVRGMNSTTRNTFLNLVGLGAPLAIAIVAIPLLVKGLGVDRFGILALIWMVVGYASIFDFGLARTLTRELSFRLSSGSEAELSALVWTTITLLVALGAVAGVCVAALARPLATSFLHVPPQMQDETIRVFRVMGMAAPLSILTAGMRGVLEAYQRFGVVNAIRLLMGTLTFLAPMLTLYVSSDLVVIALVLVATRAVAVAIHAYVIFDTMPFIERHKGFRAELVRPLLISGGWMTISNVVNPLVGYLDRLMIGAVISVAAITYYVTPNEIVTKLWIVPGAMTGALFPEFAFQATRDRARLRKLFLNSAKWLFILLFPLTFALALFSREILSVWLNDQLAFGSYRVLELLAFGILINCLAHIPFSLVQAMGRPDKLAKLHIVEFPCYAVALWIGASWGGIVGVAVVWVLRMAIDAVFVFLFASSVANLPIKPALPYIVLGTLTAAMFGLAGFEVSLSLPAKAAIYVAASLCTLLLFWFELLSADERAGVIRKLRRRVTDRYTDILNSGPFYLPSRARTPVKPNSHVLVTGTPRSGTTWIASMLAAAEGTVSVNEPFNLEPHAYRLDGLATRWLEYAPALDQARAVAAMSKVFAGQTGRVFTRRQPERYMRSLRQRRMIVKDPIAALSAEWLAANFPTQVVVVRRHPAAFVASMQRVGWVVRLDHLAEQAEFVSTLPSWLRRLIHEPAESELDRASAFWAIVNYSLGRALARHSDWIVVRQEDVARDPQHCFRNLYSALSLKWDGRVAEIVGRYSSSQNPGTQANTRTNDIRRDSLESTAAWRHVLSDEEVERIRAITHPVSHAIYADHEW